jgi:hypothetical protein
MVGDANRKGYRHLLDAFWDQAASFGLALPTPGPVSGAAFCKARSKIPPELVRTLVHRAADKFDATYGKGLRWFERRVFGIDGTKLNLRRSEELIDHFGVPSDAYCPQALAGTLFDLVSKVPHDTIIGPGASSEREHLFLLLDRLKPGDVLVLDRGYPSFEILCILQDAGIDFVIRVPASNTFGAVEELLISGKKDAVITIDPSDKGAMKDHAPIQVRALRVKPPGGDWTVIVTSLQKADDFTRSDIADLYRMRWEIEEYYKVVKGDYLGQGQFHSESVKGVEQELHALALFVAITRHLMADAAEKAGLPYESLSPKSGVLGFADYVVRLLLGGDPDHVARILDRLLDRIVRTRDPKRPGRRFERRSFRPSRKWGPQGRRGG